MLQHIVSMLLLLLVFDKDSLSCFLYCIVLCFVGWLFSYGILLHSFLWTGYATKGQARKSFWTTPDADYLFYARSLFGWGIWSPKILSPNVNKVYNKMNRCRIAIESNETESPLTQNSFANSYFSARKPMVHRSRNGIFVFNSMNTILKTWTLKYAISVSVYEQTANPSGKISKF